MSPNAWKRLLLVILTVGSVSLAQSLESPPQRRFPRRVPQIGDDIPDDTVTPKERKRQQALLKYNLKNMREDAAEMAKLANSIQEDLERTSENELPLKVVAKAEQVEKLAKRIKNTAKGH